MNARAFRGCRLAAAASLASAIVVELIALTLGGEAPHGVLLAVAASPVGMSAFFVFVVMATAQERTLVFRLTIAVALGVSLIVWACGYPPATAALAGGACIPGAIFAYLGVRAFRARGDERAAAIDFLAATSIIATSGLSMIFFLGLSTQYFNPIFDATYIRIDELFGAQPSAVVRALFDLIPALKWTCVGVYFLLPVAQACMAALEAHSPERTTGLGILPGFIVTAILGYALYALMPAIGPVEFLGRDFPMMHIGTEYLAGRSAIDLDPNHIRGAMPSLHITWAALLYLAGRRMGQPVRIASAVFLALTFLATLGLGMHYLIDLIVAAPLIVLVRGICAVDLPWAQANRAAAVGIGGVLLAAWVVVTHGNVDIERDRLVLMLLIALTLAVPLQLGLRLDRAEARAQKPASRPDAPPAWQPARSLP